LIYNLLFKTQKLGSYLFSLFTLFLEYRIITGALTGHAKGAWKTITKELLERAFVVKTKGFF